MKYNYIYIGSSDLGHLKPNLDGYYNICIQDLRNCKNIQVVSMPLENNILFLRILYALHHSGKINKIVKLPLKFLWYPLYFKSRFDDNEPLCIIFQNLNFSSNYFYYVRKKFPKAKIVKIHRDNIELTRKRCKGLTDDVINNVFDLSLSFDEAEAKKYNYLWFSEFESKLNDISQSENYPECDVFFAGKAKDRLEKLYAIYDKLTSFGLKVHYYIVGIPKEKQIQLDGVTYSNKLMSYKEMLYHTVNCRCVLDVNQENTVGYTSRFLEAVMYNKPLIADNLNIRASKFYNPDFIQVYDDWNDLDPNFVKKDEKRVDYHYNGEFSPIHLIEQIDHELVARYGI
ncbi:hypothetical protein [Bacteroides intestinalis]|uniref:Glycosyltransferase family 1 protein n=1 Tax=Bacteroides intestinalis TaxID=329854 RepID=A0A139LI79_9BACE|nr:hypothetical protein [Bacteroides intestinalis]KXT51147.1 hypothetical protein HMPREF2531_02144 [Bacteroides intestinalis]